MDAVEIIDAFVKYLYNTEPAKIYERVYGQPSHANESYSYEKIKEMQWDPLRWWGTLDLQHQRRLADAVLPAPPEVLTPEETSEKMKSLARKRFRGYANSSSNTTIIPVLL